MEPIIIISNPGSASKKYAVYASGIECASFHFENNGDGYVCSHKVYSTFEKVHITAEQYVQSLGYVKEKLKASEKEKYVLAIRCVIPHIDFVQDIKLTPRVITKIKSLHALDPIHIQPVLDEIEWGQQLFKKIDMYGISDSSFHIRSSHTLPVAHKDTIQTIGYHGLSCESVLESCRKENVVYEKMIIAHLGSGSSITAIKNGKSIYTSMTHSPLSGVLMATRPGDLDILAVLKICYEKNLTYTQALEYFYTSCGLLGLSGISADLRVLRAQAFGGNMCAKETIQRLVSSIVQQICKAGGEMEGFDTLVFTGTIGFRANYIREMVLEKLRWLGVSINHDANQETFDHIFKISDHDSRVQVFVVYTDEMKQMYAHICAHLKI